MSAIFRAGSGRTTIRMTGIQECITGAVYDAGRDLAKVMARQSATGAPHTGPQVRKGRWVQRYSLKDPTAYYTHTWWAGLQVYSSVGCRAEHAKWVHEGTRPGPIKAKHGIRLSGYRSSSFFTGLPSYMDAKYMFIPPGPWGPRLARSVAGQRAKPWMAEAMVEAMGRKRYL